MTVTERFAEKHTPVPESGCWLWTGQVSTARGYGVFFDGERQVYAHRYSYQQHVGSILPGRIVMHKCDVRSCVNPNHLHLGSNADNSADMVRKGRQARGERNGRARLSDKQVQAIREDAGTIREIAARHRVAASHVGNIRNGKKRKENS